LSDEYTDTDLRNQADAYWQTAVGKLPDLGWGQGANASEAGLFTNSLTDSAVSYLAGRAYIGANGVANTLQLTNSVYRLRVARNEQPQRLRWAEVFYPADGSAPQAVQVREVIMPASSSESYTQEFTIAPPQSAGGVKLEPAGSGLAVSLPIQASDGSGPRLYVANALFTNQTADMNVNLVNTAGTTSVIVTTTGSSVTLIAIDPNVDFHQGRAAALADGQVIASGTDLWSLPNRPGVGGWSLVAVGAQSGTTAISFAVTTFGATQTHSYTLSVYPLIELAVDANRDGLIKLASEDGSDATSSSNPFRFWLNEGEDGPGSEAEETAEPGSFGSKHDYQHDRINYKRDLEDWTRLKLRLPASLVVYMAAQSPSEATGGLTINLEWNTATLQQATIPIPGLKFVAAVDGSKDYLKDVVAAERQITGIQGKIIGSVDASSVKYMLPGSLFKTNPNGVLEADLLFEGMAPGRGQLVLSIFRDGQRLVEANPINIEIRPMQEFYEHWTANTADTDKPDAVNPVFPEALHPEGSHPAPFAFKPTDAGLSLPNDPEGNEYILFVHGFRMKPYERRVFAETAAKRLYQLGYRGKFGFFSWPTEWVNYDVWLDKLVNALADPDIYDRCEATARASGSGPLANLLIGLRSRFGANHVHIFAHSMGNVVVSEALRALLQKSDGPNAAQYVACQSAEVASAYDPTVFTGNSSASPLLGGPDRYTYSPDLVRASTESGLKSGDNYHKGVASRAGVMTNFFNGTDSALSTWKINQDLKPDNSIWLGDTTFSYDSVEDVSANPARFRDRYQENPPGLTKPNQRHELHWEAVPDRYRILAFIIEARSKAVGATAGVKGEFQGVEVDLDGKDYAFDKIHSAEFLGDPIVARKFYQKLLTTFDLKQYETE
jgi:pimeloyl-ACP methyl ester carboxylesterase